MIARRQDHLWSLDLIRFAAALLVAIFHLTWKDQRGATVAWFGWIGVQIFFVISGFVIARSAQDSTPGRFALSRFLRLYPAAWICAFIALIVSRFVHSTRPDLMVRFFWSVLLYPTGPYLAGAYWTLPIEITFYAVVFVLILRGMFHRLEGLGIYLCLSSAAYNVAYALQCAGYLPGPDLEFGFDWKNLTLLRHGIYFAIGIFLWLWSERRLNASGRAALILALAVAPLEITCRSAEIVGLSPVNMALGTVWPVPVLIWVVALAVIAFSARWEADFRSPPAVFLNFARVAGLTTYPLYLIHEQFGEAARNAVLLRGLPYWFAIVVAMTSSIALAVLVARTAEPALRRLLRLWLRLDGRPPAKRRDEGRLIATRRARRVG